MTVPQVTVVHTSQMGCKYAVICAAWMKESCSGSVAAGAAATLMKRGDKASGLCQSCSTASSAPYTELLGRSVIIRRYRNDKASSCWIYDGDR